MSKEEILQKLVEIYNSTETESELAEAISILLTKDLKQDIAEQGLFLRTEW